MLSFNDKISIRQLQILLILDIFGSGVTTLPRLVAEQAGQDGWICVLLATAAVIFFTMILCRVPAKYPDKNFAELTAGLLSKPIGTLICLALLIKLLARCAIELRVFGEIIRQTMLPATPFSVVCALMILIGAFAAAKGYETRGRIAEILIFIVILPLVVIYGAASGDVDFSNLLPLAVSSPTEIGSGTLTAVFAFNGIEMVMLAVPYLSRPQHTAKASMQSVGIIGILMTVLTLITIARFGPYGIMHQMWPVIEMMDTIDLPGSFIERQDALMMSFWIVSVFALVNACLFFSSVLMKDTINRGKRPFYILFAAPVIFLLSFVPENITEAYEWMFFLNKTFGAAFLFVIPCVLLIADKVKGAFFREKGV